MSAGAKSIDPMGAGAEHVSPMSSESVTERGDRRGL